MSLNHEQNDMDEIPLIIQTGKFSELPLLGSRPEKKPLPVATQKENYLIGSPDAPVFVVSYLTSKDWREEKQRIQDMIRSAEPNGNSFEAAKAIYAMTTEKFAEPVTYEKVRKLSAAQKQTLQNILTDEEGFVRIRVPLVVDDKVQPIKFQERGVSPTNRYVLEVKAKVHKETNRMEVKLKLGTPDNPTWEEVPVPAPHLLRVAGELIVRDYDETSKKSLVHFHPKHLDSSITLIQELFSLPKAEQMDYLDMFEQVYPIHKTLIEQIAKKYTEYKETHPLRAKRYLSLLEKTISCKDPQNPFDNFDILLLRSEGFEIQLPS